MKMYNFKISVITFTVILIAITLVWFFQGYYNINIKKEDVFDKSGNKLNLEQVLMVFRHGIRTPVTFMSYDRNNDKKYFPDGLGQLTREGKMQLYEMGRRMRLRYYDLINPYSIYTSSDIRAVSTKVNRCFQSAALLLAGLYPPVGHQIWNQKLKWQPVTILSESIDKTYMLTDPKSCPSYFQELNSLNISDPNAEFLYNHFSKYMNLTNEKKKLRELFMICDAIQTEVKMKLPQPDWIEQVYSDKILNFIKFGISVTAENFKLQRIISGMLITEIVQQINKTISRSDYSKIYLHSAHDTSVNGIMRILGFPMNVLPDYGSAVIFELYSSDNGNYYIKILYNNDVSFLNLETKKMEQCEELCSFEEFVNIVNPFFITQKEWEKECASK